MNEELKKAFDKHFDNMESQFNNLNSRLDKMIVKKEEQNEEIRQSLERILKNLEG